MEDIDTEPARYLSVCSGIEAASVAWHPLGWQPLAFSEIEPFPRAVLAHHYPHVQIHGDFTKLRDMDFIVDADVLVGGTPCQAFSVAGLRNSLADDRGNLSLEYVRLADAIDDLRLSAGRKPAVILWENVPGVLSVKDNAFGCFLAALAGDVAPYVPPRGKWTDAGVVAGPQRTVAWRILDAQYFGLAQRRRRVFVVASAREGFDPAAVLLELEGVRRDTAPSRKTRETTAHSTAPCLTSSGRGVERTLDTECGGGKLTHQSLANGHVIGTITARMFNALGARDVEEGAVLPCYLDPLNQSANTYIAKTLAARDDMDGMGVVTCATGEITHALTTRAAAEEDGTGRGNPIVPCAQPIPFDTTQLTSPFNYSKPQAGDPCHPLAAGAHPPAIAFPANLSGTQCAAAEDIAPAMGAKNPTAVAVPIQEVGKRTGTSTTDPRAGIGIGEDGDAMYTLQAGAQHGVAIAGAICKDSFSGGLGGRPEGAAAGHFIPTSMAVRRLTPVECERLQGFPDAYTMIPWRGKPAADCPDGPRYKALGNSMAVPCMRWIGARINQQLAADADNA